MKSIEQLAEIGQLAYRSGVASKTCEQSWSDVALAIAREALGPVTEDEGARLNFDSIEAFNHIAKSRLSQLTRPAKEEKPTPEIPEAAVKAGELAYMTTFTRLGLDGIPGKEVVSRSIEACISAAMPHMKGVGNEAK